jgi:hypothetical protein
MMFPRVRNNGYKPPPAAYTLTAGAASFNEGSTATFTLTTVSVAPNTELTYTVSGVDAADIVGGATSGPVTTDTNGQATISIQIAADLTTEGPETMTVRVRQGGISGTVLASASITVNDTSVNNEILTLSPTTVNLAQTFTTTSTGGQPNTGFTVTWTRNGVSYLSGSGTLDGSGNASIPGSFNQSGSFVLTVTYAGSGNVRTASLTVNQESLSISPTTVNPGQAFTTTSTGGVPNTGFTFTWTRNGVLQPNLGGSGTLDGSGNASIPGSLNQSGSYVLAVTYAASGNVRTASLTVNQESVSIPGSVQAYQLFTISSSGGVPNTGFTFTWTRNGVFNSSGSGTLDGSGNYSSGNVASLNTAGSWVLTVTFSGSGNVVSRSISVFENLSISPSSVARNQGFTVTASGGVPNSGFSFTWRRSGTTILSASGMLDSGGNFVTGGSFPDAGFYILTVTFSSTGNSASATVNVT